MITITIAPYTLAINAHSICDTGSGLGGYFDATLPDGRRVRAAGIWDDPARCTDMLPRCDERVEVDGDDFNGITVEDIAMAIWSAVAGA